MKSKKLLSMVLIGGMILSNCLPVYADTNSITNGGVIETKEMIGGEIIAEPKNEDCEVYYRTAEIFTLTIPKKINLDGTQKNPTQQFGVSAKGDIDGNSKITVKADEKFYLKQNKKSDVESKVIKGSSGTDPFIMIIKSENLYNESIEDYAYTNSGSVIVPTENEEGTTNKLSAGAWSGIFKFYINYENGDNIEDNQEEIQNRTAGYYAEDGTYTAWEDINADFNYNEATRNSIMKCPATYTNKLVFGDNITEISGNSFNGSRIKEIVLPTSIKKIQGAAFMGASNLEKITYKGTVEEFNQIELNEVWGKQCPVDYVICSNGEVEIPHIDMIS